MAMRREWMGLACGLAGSILLIASAWGSEDEEFTRKWRAANVALFDHLRADPSSRVQVLAADLYLGKDDTLLGPTPDDIVARAARLAPDDAFVQWTAARDGNYWSNSCGPAVRPEAAVANLLRLEPDNAAVWTYAVALASLAGDQDSVDSALSRMASAKHADDHLIEHWHAWRDVFAANPNLRDPSMGFEHVPAERRAEVAAYFKADGGTGSAARVMRAACSTDAGERTWQRLGWCADAGRLLAAKGGSLELRGEGLELLEAIGDRSDETARLRRQLEWLRDHHRMPDGDADKADWQGVTTQIEAIERRLARLGEPASVPEVWTSSEETARNQASTIRDYWRSLAEAMRADADVRMQALAASLEPMLMVFDAFTPMAEGDDKGAALADLAAKHPDDVLVQWIATGNEQGGGPMVMANLQRLEPDNAAALGMPLGTANEDVPETADILRKMASAARFEVHFADRLGLWLEALRRTPPPDDLLAIRRLIGDPAPTADVAAKTMAYGLANFAHPPMNLMRACAEKAVEDVQRRDDCITIGRLMLHSDEIMLTVMVGGEILKQAGALDGVDLARLRSAMWWWTFSRQGTTTGMPDEAMLDDVIANGSEVEAMRRFAERAGKATPPDDWKLPGG